jgi:hypothetical protein
MYCRFLCNILTELGIFSIELFARNGRPQWTWKTKKEKPCWLCAQSDYMYIHSLSILCAPLYLNFDKYLHLHLYNNPLIFAFNHTHTPRFLHAFLSIFTCKYFVDAVQSIVYLLQQANLKSGSHRENEVPNMPPHRLFNWLFKPYFLFWMDKLAIWNMLLDFPCSSNGTHIHLCYTYSDFLFSMKTT